MTSYPVKSAFVFICIFLMVMASSRSIGFEEAQSYALAQLGLPQLSLKEEQKQAIHAICSGSDVFVWLPTGFGKSVCFQTLPFVFDFKRSIVGASNRSMAIVVAALVVLMVGIEKSDIYCL